MDYEWDPHKAASNRRKHGVDSADAVTVLEAEMKKQYDFSKARRGAVIKPPPGKTRITIRIDDDVLEWFKDQVHRAGGGNYQSLINQALREYMTSGSELIEDVFRRVLREELPRQGPKRAAGRGR